MSVLEQAWESRKKNQTFVEICKRDEKLGKRNKRLFELKAPCYWIPYVKILAVLVCYSCAFTSQVFIHRNLQFVDTKRTLAFLHSQEFVLASTPAWIQGVTTHLIPPRIILVHAKAEAFWKGKRLHNFNCAKKFSKLDLKWRFGVSGSCFGFLWFRLS